MLKEVQVETKPKKEKNNINTNLLNNPFQCLFFCLNSLLYRFSMNSTENMNIRKQVIYIFFFFNLQKMMEYGTLADLLNEVMKLTDTPPRDRNYSKFSKALNLLEEKKHKKHKKNQQSKSSGKYWAKGF